MQIKQVQETKTYTVDKYIAEDGKEFSSQQECLVYERKLFLGKKSAPLFTTSFPSIDGEHCMCLFYLKSQDDVDYIITDYKILKGYFYTDFDQNGESWYLFWWENGGDWPDTYRLYHYETYIKEAEENLACFKREVKEAMDAAEGKHE